MKCRRCGQRAKFIGRQELLRGNERFDSVRIYDCTECGSFVHPQDVIKIQEYALGERLITLRQAAHDLGLAYSTLAQYAREGRFRVWQIGNKVRRTTRRELQKAIARGDIASRKF